MSDADFSEVVAFLDRYRSTSPRRRARLVPDAPFDGLRSAALNHPDAFVRRACLALLDHLANDESTQVFASALADPVDLVRHMALHSIACERCRTEELCASDVVPLLSSILESDPSPEVRHKTIPLLMRLADRDREARPAVELAASRDADPVLREAAARAARGEHIRARKMYVRHSRTRQSR